jgi:hypothetical protein
MVWRLARIMFSSAGGVDVPLPFSFLMLAATVSSDVATGAL